METVSVAVRVRPLVKSELECGSKNCVLADSVTRRIIVNKKNECAFNDTFNYVFTPEHSQCDVYTLAVEDLIKKLYCGYNVTIIAYGQTGSGKTYSMGTHIVDDDNEEKKGIIPRAIQNIFNEASMRHDAQKAKFSIKVSYIEIYQEQIYDLLSPNRANLNIRGEGHGTSIPGLTEISVNSYSKTMKYWKRGSSNRVTATTAMNARSSRSHCIFTITISQMFDDENNTKSKFHLVDLAGQQQSKKTKAKGERLQESVNINKGLLSLGNIITSLSEKSVHISYRDSKLTRLLQDSLGGNSITLMIACISPADYNIEETVSTLGHAKKTLLIRNKPIINEDPFTDQNDVLPKENIFINEAPRKIFVCKLNECITHEDIKNHFNQFGDVDEVFFLRPFRGIAVVSFTEPNAVLTTLGENHTIKGIPLVVSLTMPKVEDPKSKSKRSGNKSGGQIVSVGPSSGSEGGPSSGSGLISSGNPDDKHIRVNQISMLDRATILTMVIGTILSVAAIMIVIEVLVSKLIQII